MVATPFAHGYANCVTGEGRRGVFVDAPRQFASAVAGCESAEAHTALGSVEVSAIAPPSSLGPQSSIFVAGLGHSGGIPPRMAFCFGRRLAGSAR